MTPRHDDAVKRESKLNGSGGAHGHPDGTVRGVQERPVAYEAAGGRTAPDKVVMALAREEFVKNRRLMDMLA